MGEAEKKRRQERKKEKIKDGGRDKSSFQLLPALAVFVKKHNQRHIRTWTDEDVRFLLTKLVVANLSLKTNFFQLAFSTGYVRRTRKTEARFQIAVG